MSIWNLAKASAVVAALAVATILGSFVVAQEVNQITARHHVVEIRNFEFVPETLTIRQGDTVEWVNRDIAPHTATNGDRAWDAGNLASNQSAVVAFASPGAAPYICRYHPKMRGEIVVEAE